MLAKEFTVKAGDGVVVERQQSKELSPRVERLRDLVFKIRNKFSTITAEVDVNNEQLVLDWETKERDFAEIDYLMWPGGKDALGIPIGRNTFQTFNDHDFRVHVFKDMTPMMHARYEDRFKQIRANLAEYEQLVGAVDDIWMREERVQAGYVQREQSITSHSHYLKLLRSSSLLKTLFNSREINAKKIAEGVPEGEYDDSTFLHLTLQLFLLQTNHKPQELQGENLSPENQWWSENWRLILRLTSFFHDFGKVVAPREPEHGLLSAEIAREYLESRGFEPKLIEAVTKAIEVHHFFQFVSSEMSDSVKATKDSIRVAVDNPDILTWRPTRQQFEKYKDVNKFKSLLVPPKRILVDGSVEPYTEEEEELIAEAKTYPEKFLAMDFDAQRAVVLSLYGTKPIGDLNSVESRNQYKDHMMQRAMIELYDAILIKGEELFKKQVLNIETDVMLREISNTANKKFGGRPGVPLELVQKFMLYLVDNEVMGYMMGLFTMADTSTGAMHNYNYFENIIFMREVVKEVQKLKKRKGK